MKMNNNNNIKNVKKKKNEREKQNIHASLSLYYEANHDVASTARVLCCSLMMALVDFYGPRCLPPSTDP